MNKARQFASSTPLSIYAKPLASNTKWPYLQPDRRETIATRAPGRLPSCEVTDHAADDEPAEKETTKTASSISVRCSVHLN